MSKTTDKATRLKHQISGCTVVRHVLVTHSTMNLATGATTPGHQEWVTKPCGIPLFGDAERSRASAEAAPADGRTPTTTAPTKEPQHDPRHWRRPLAREDVMATDQPTRGGRRSGAGRAPNDPNGEVMKTHNVRMTDRQWADLKLVTQAAMRAWVSKQARKLRKET